MKIAVLGTGVVGRTVADRLATLGHDVVIGTRNVDATLGRAEPDSMGNPPFAQWHADHRQIGVVDFAEAGSFGDIVVNATTGGGSLVALESVGADNLSGKVVLDVANPLDFSHGMPPVLSVSNTDSLAEQIQRAFPQARVVKALNTMNALLMVRPTRIPGNHSVFVAGDDAEAKQIVMGLLHEFGWAERSIVDLGGIRSSRGLEMYLPLWLSLRQALGTGDFNINIVRA